ncbi:MAG: hypothetical protein IPO63_04805 [Bacteroidetes bacterium]|nr:hypothetical protein [Bacteroidota bacterium]
MDVTTLDQGYHLLHYRVKDTSGIWSVAKSHLFLKNTIQNALITGYEYWFDQNFSSRITRSIVPSVNPIINEALDASTLTNGLHWFYIRTKDSTGFYSSPISALIAKVDFQGIGNEITGYEYWFNSDFTNRVTQNTTSAGNVVLLTNLSTTSLADGLNRVNFRFKDKANQWSIVYTQEFEKTDSVNQNNLIINPSCDLPLVNSKIPFWAEVGITGWTRGSSNPIL